MQEEPTSLDALANLLGDIRGASGGAGGRGIKTRSKAAAASSNNASGKGKGRVNGIRDNPLFKPTPLQELYLGDEQPSDAELAQRMVWEQLEMRTSKILDLYKEIVRDGDSSGEEDEGGEGEMEEGFDEGDSDEELVDGEEGEDDDEDMDPDLYDEEESDVEDLDDMDDDLDDEEQGEYTPPERPEPYFAPLRDGTAVDNDEDDEDAEEDAEEEEEAESDSEIPAHRRKAGKAGKSAQPKSAKGKSPVDRGFFSLSEFNSQTNDAEDQMTRYMRIGKSKSANDISLNGLEDDDEEDEEIDYFAPAAGMGDDEDDEDEDGMDEDEEEEEGTRPEDMRYDDFWKPPKLLYGDSPKQVAKGKDRQQKVNGQNSHGKAKGKPKSKPAEPEPEEPASDADIPVNPTRPDSKKRRVSFHDAVKVQEFESDNPGKKSAIAALVKRFGMKEAMKRIASGDIGEEDLEDEEDEDEEDDEDDLMLSDMLDNDGEEGEEMDEDDDEEDDDAESAISDESGDADSRAMRRISRDLFADEEDEEEDEPTDSSKALTPAQKKKAQQSRYEARMAALSEQIAELEAENVGERDWTLKGEAKSRDRPINSLLEEDLEFDQVAKVVPVVTEESNLSLEDKIKKRILDVSIFAFSRGRSLMFTPTGPIR